MLRRSSLVLWAVAFALTAIPYVYWAFAAESAIYVVAGSRACPGFDLHSEVSSVLAPLHVVPGPLIVVAGCGLWALLVRKGLPRWGRAVGWLAAVGLTWPFLITVGFATTDLVVGEECGQTWAPFLQLGWTGLRLLTGVLVVVAVRVRRTTPRGRAARTAGTALAVLLLLSMQTGDGTVGKVTEATEERCDPWRLRYGDRPASRTDRETAFVCVARGERLFLPPRFRDLPDPELVAFGRDLCRGSMRADRRELDRLRDTTGVAVGTVETTQALTLLCPEVDAREQAEEKQQKAENDAFVAAAQQRCLDAPAHRPRIRPVVRGAATVWSDYGAVTAAEGEEPVVAALDRAFDNDLVGTARGEVAILTADEVMHVCVTVEGYGTRPPVERKGWEKVVEVGYTSTRGELTRWEGETFPNPLVKGRGRYRIRVHMRGAQAAMEEDGNARQQFLVIIFPGASSTPRTLTPTRKPAR
ncbi:hypothetical protein ACFXJ8_20535 [Nonomuraea sp. NPDC059194]|uniref:hypothetical protein n=1 Tax=Nonomuraea sp. NPDC059194 TaxID=3346764 RepID=UPI0036C3AA28